MAPLLHLLTLIMTRTAWTLTLARRLCQPKADYPIIKADELKAYDGILFGFPTRYGRANGATSAFFDQQGGLWATGALTGKFAGIFTSTASQHGGQETTALSTLPYFAHMGLVFVPIGEYTQRLSCIWHDQVSPRC